MPGYPDTVTDYISQKIGNDTLSRILREKSPELFEDVNDRFYRYLNEDFDWVKVYEFESFGLKCAIRDHPMGRCGYVECPPKCTNEDGFDVHGGITGMYEGMIGFDTSHADDIKTGVLTSFIRMGMFDNKTDDFILQCAEVQNRTYWSMEKTKNEVIKLASQIYAIISNPQ